MRKIGVSIDIYAPCDNNGFVNTLQNYIVPTSYDTRSSYSKIIFFYQQRGNICYIIGIIKTCFSLLVICLVFYTLFIETFKK